MKNAKLPRFVIASAILLSAIIYWRFFRTQEEPMLDFHPGDSYDRAWNVVDSLKDKGLFLTALKLTNKICEQAKKENNSGEVVRALINRYKFNSYINERSNEFAIYDLRNELKTSKFPLTPVLHSVLAEMYWKYYELDRGIISQRTNQTGVVNDSVDTWDALRFADATAKEYQLSLVPADSLRRTHGHVFIDVMEHAGESYELRPTLYDFLAFRAIEFFESEEPSVMRPAEEFTLDNPAYFQPVSAFAELGLQTQDTMSYKFYALKYLRDEVGAHLHDDDPDALVDADLTRLKFVYVNSTVEEKDSLYEDALRQLAANYPDNEITADVYYAMAVYHHQLALTYRPGEKTSKSEDHRAVELCDYAIHHFHGSLGEQNCADLEEEILKKSINLSTENAVLPGQPSVALLAWRNVPHLWFRLVKADEALQPRQENLSREDVLRQQLALPLVDSWEMDLPVDSNYFMHTAEIKIPAVDPGKYILLASFKKDFPVDSNVISSNIFWSTSLSYVQRDLENGSTEFLVLDRQTGDPLPEIRAQLWREEYNYDTREYEYRKLDGYTTDAQGNFTVPYKENGFIVEFTGTRRHFISPGYSQYKSYYEKPKKEPQTFFFTDRSIYRPGQTVFFKGITIEGDGTTSAILKNRKTTVEFLDVNYQVVKKLNLTTNDFGSFSGSFIAPASGLTGQMHIQNESGSVWFSVEEYKRPKFEVTTEPVREEYRLNDSIHFKGNAKTFAGTALNGAQVKYTVYRSYAFPWWWSAWNNYYSYSNASTVMLTGTTTTNDTGGFVIPFKAAPDPKVSSEGKPTFTYNINISVTDITGETHDAQGYVSAGYVAMLMAFNLPQTIEKSDTTTYNVSLTNLSGQPDTALVQYTIYKLKNEKSSLRARPWSAPDKFLYTKQQWKAWFPEDIYGDEREMTKHEKEKTVLSASIYAGKEHRLKLQKQNFAPGDYMLEAKTKDKFGEEVIDVRYFSCFDKTAKKIASPAPWSFQPLVTMCKPGEKASILLGTAEKGLKVLYEIEKDGKIVSSQRLELNDEQMQIEIPVGVKEKENFAVHFACVFHNRGYTEDEAIVIDEGKTDLDISYETFRDKLQPGVPEEWKLKVKGPKSEKVAAEMVAAMYDASLDEFRGHSWDFSLGEAYSFSRYWRNEVNAVSNCDYWDDQPAYPRSYFDRTYESLNWFDFYMRQEKASGWFDLGNLYYDQTEAAPLMMDGLYTVTVSDANGCCAGQSVSVNASNIATTGAGAYTYDWSVPDNTLRDELQKAPAGGNDRNRFVPALSPPPPPPPFESIKARTNLNETVFFFPQLQTDSSGAVVIKFTMNEALTKWRFMAFAHTKDLKYGMTEKEVITRKDLMVMPNPPRFLREGDKITFTAKVSNTSEKDLSGSAKLLLFDATTMKPLDKIISSPAQLSFSLKKGLSAPLSWDLAVPDGVSAITYRVVASAGNFTDGEESALPVLSNRMLVTETMPMYIRNGQTKEFRFEKLLGSGNSTSTIRNQKLTLEFTSNPAWYAVQALPYLIEYPYECAEQTFSRYYANSLATNIANSSPKIRAVFDSWRAQGPDAFLSNLEKNQDLKNVVLTETPWVLDAQDENERKKRVGLLFDMNRMANEQTQALAKLRDLQVSNGGWPWFEGMPDDRYITQYIITGFGHLDQLGVTSIRDDRQNWRMVTNGIGYLDARILEDYNDLLKPPGVDTSRDFLNETIIQYLYARSYFTDIPVYPAVLPAYNYYMRQAKKYWPDKSRYMQGMLALALSRSKEQTTADEIMKSLSETALHSDEMGMYWKENVAGYYWYESPVETQSLLIEAYKDVSHDQKSVDEMRIWLLKNKQTNDWKTTTATANACYALLLDGTSWLATESNVQIVVGSTPIDPKQMNLPQEPGTGYFKTSWSADQIKPEMGKITVTKTGPGISWGAMYWQYFEDIDKITAAKTPLSVTKKLFRIKNTNSGEVAEPVTDATTLQPGDKIRVHIELRNDRDMQYVHMKDMRASGFEPVNVLSQYKWQDGLGYYESTKDASTDFFFSFLPKGTHVFEYALTVIHAGDFSNGLTQVQCMYAPEFSAHSEGTRVKVGKPAT